ncbi:MAG: hypothetical protein H8F28_25310 [Fibrella sp.]|nr:hypothetical protein [Armatimonadota bacterium]
MKQTHSRAFALIALLPATGLMLIGCPKQEAESGEAPYGQPASQTTNMTPPPAAPEAAVPPGPKMSGKPDTMPGAGDPPAAMGAPPGPAMGGPMMSGGGDPMAPLTPTPELDKEIKAAEAKGDKKTIAAAYASRGYSRMTDDNAGQRVKYRKALEDFRVALKNDPANAKAKQNKAIIEEIYTSMGRPVPQ